MQNGDKGHGQLQPSSAPIKGRSHSLTQEQRQPFRSVVEGSIPMSSPPPHSATPPPHFPRPREAVPHPPPANNSHHSRRGPCGTYSLMDNETEKGGKTVRPSRGNSVESGAHKSALPLDSDSEQGTERPLYWLDALDSGTFLDLDETRPRRFSFGGRPSSLRSSNQDPYLPPFSPPLTPPTELVILDSNSFDSKLYYCQTPSRHIPFPPTPPETVLGDLPPAADESTRLDTAYSAQYATPSTMRRRIAPQKPNVAVADRQVEEGLKRKEAVLGSRDSSKLRRLRLAWGVGLLLGLSMLALGAAWLLLPGEATTSPPRFDQSSYSTFPSIDILIRSSLLPTFYTALLSFTRIPQIPWTSILEPRNPYRNHYPSTQHQVSSQYPSSNPSSHSQSLDHPERNTLVLYRILGNDLPPRHSPGQTLRNLEFLLSHETDFSFPPPHVSQPQPQSTSYRKLRRANRLEEAGSLRVEKYYVLNRIVDPDNLRAIVDLLHRYSVPDSRILVIPFKWSEYRQIEFRWDENVDKALDWGVGRQESSRSLLAPIRRLLGRWSTPSPNFKNHFVKRLRALDYTYHDKNLYSMNNNGGRNSALAHGRSLPHARWILPLDGNSFFTPSAMASIARTLSNATGPPQYLVIPMARLLSNEHVLLNNSIPAQATIAPSSPSAVESDLNLAPDTPEEPQVGFRFDSTESYQEAMRYGRRSKLELLWRLGVIPREKRLDKKSLPWEKSDHEYITASSWRSIRPAENVTEEDQGDGDSNAYIKAGWVYRLFSGDKSQEESSPEAVSLRAVNRLRGILDFLETLDERVARGSEGGESEPTDVPCASFSKDRLWTVSDARVEELRASHLARQSNATDIFGTTQAALDAKVQHAERLLGNPSWIARAEPHLVATTSYFLALAGRIKDNATYSTLAADLVRSRFSTRIPLSPSTSQVGGTVLNDRLVAGYVFPFDSLQTGSWNAALAFEISNGSRVPSFPFDPLGFDPSHLLDAVRLLSHSNAPRSQLLPPSTEQTLRSLFVSHLTYLLFHPQAIELSHAHSSRRRKAFDYDTSVGALASFLDDARLLGRVANRARGKLDDSARGGRDAEWDAQTKVDLARSLANVGIRSYFRGQRGEVGR